MFEGKAFVSDDTLSDDVLGITGASATATVSDDVLGITGASATATVSDVLGVTGASATATVSDPVRDSVISTLVVSSTHSLLTFLCTDPSNDSIA